MIFLQMQDPEDWDLVNFNVSLCNVIPMKPVAPEEVKDMNAEEAEAYAERACGEAV